MRKNLLSALAAFFLISLLLFIFRESSPSLFIQGVAQSVYKAPKAALYSFSAGSENKGEVEILRQENTSLRERLVELDHIRSDNAALKSQFEEESIEANELLPASVIGFQGGIADPEVLIIDQGGRSGVIKGQAVVVGKSLVGIIDSVGDRYSSVLVITNSSFSTVAKTSDKGTLGVIQGGGDFLLFDRVAVTDELKKGETVVTRGTMTNEQRGLPPDLVLGVVESVRKVESEPFQGAQIKSTVNIAQLVRVFVWK